MIAYGLRLVLERIFATVLMPSTQRNEGEMAKQPKKPMTQGQIIEELAEEFEMSKGEVKKFLSGLAELATHEMKKGSGQFTIPEMGVKLSLVRKPATKARPGRNPATGEAITIKAKPARNVAKATVMKKLKVRLGLA